MAIIETLNFLYDLLEGVNDYTIYLVLEQTYQDIPWGVAQAFAFELSSWGIAFKGAGLPEAWLVLVGLTIALFVGMFAIPPKFQVR